MTGHPGDGIEMVQTEEFRQNLENEELCGDQEHEESAET
jgi:hypothetical protein